MPVLSKNKVVLFVCRAVNPFITTNLLERTPDGVKPIAGAKDVGIKDVMIQLHKEDKRLNLHTIDDIIRNIFDDCEAEGFSVSISKSRLIAGKYATVGVFAGFVKATAIPLED